MIIGRQLFESYRENEKLFSTGNDELDDLLQEVYYSGIEDGYDYAQKEYSDKEKAGTAAGGALAGAGAAGYGITKLAKAKASRHAKKELAEIESLAQKDLHQSRVELLSGKSKILGKLKDAEKGAEEMISKSREPWAERNLFDRIRGARKEKLAKKEAQKVIDSAKSAAKSEGRKLTESHLARVNRIRETADKASQAVKEKAGKKVAKLGKAGKIALAATAVGTGLAAASAGAKRAKASREARG